MGENIALVISSKQVPFQNLLKLSRGEVYDMLIVNRKKVGETFSNFFSIYYEHIINFTPGKFQQILIFRTVTDESP